MNFHKIILSKVQNIPRRPAGKYLFVSIVYGTDNPSSAFDPYEKKEIDVEYCTSIPPKDELVKIFCIPQSDTKIKVIKWKHMTKEELDNFYLNIKIMETKNDFPPEEDGLCNSSLQDFEDDSVCSMALEVKVNFICYYN